MLVDKFVRCFCFWFLRIKELKGVVFISADVGLMPKQVWSNRSVSDSLQPRFLKVSDPSSVGFLVPQCGFKRRIWRRTSSECHLNPSNVYSTLFHVSQMSWEDASLGFGDQEGHCGVTWEWWSSWDLLDIDVLHFIFVRYISFCCLTRYLNTDTARIISHLFFFVHLSIFIWPFVCFYISSANFYFVFSHSFYSVHTYMKTLGGENMNKI